MLQGLASKATLGRLPMYLEYLQQLDPRKTQFVSAAGIARALHLGEVQVRKDLNAVCGKGRPRVGYELMELLWHIDAFLGGVRNVEAILVGAGKLGRALLDYDGFAEYGLEIVAAFDVRPGAPGISDADKPILPLEQLETFCRQRQIRLGIMTVPSPSAQQICDRLVNCGIRGIWNFAPAKLVVPSHITLQQENLALSLAHLNQQTNGTIGGNE